LSGDLFKEPGGKVNVRLVQKDDPSIQAQINNLLVDNDGSWLFKPKITQFNGLKSGEYLVMVQGVDAAGNISDWSSAQSLYLDVTEPSLPTIDRLPTLSTTVDVEGNELSVVNNVSLQDSSKVFSGQAEPSSKVTLTLFDSRLPPGVIIKTVVADAVDGSWSLTLNLQEWQSLSEGVIACKVKSTDASGNVSRESDPKRFYMDLTPPANPGVELSDSVVLRVNPQYPTIRFLNLEDFQNGTWIQGTGEKGNKITLEINGQLVDSSIVVDSNNNWRYMLVNTPQKNWAQLLPDGVLTIEVQAIDLVKNPSQKVSYQRFVIEKHTQLPSPPTDLGLVPGEDTGRPNETQTLVDQKTNKQAPKLQWKIPNNTQTFIWFDANDNGQLEPEEKTPVAVPVGMIQNNMVTYQLQL
jgi:hypothetical protein